MPDISYVRNGEWMTVTDDNRVWADVRVGEEPIVMVLEIDGQTITATYDPLTDTWTGVTPSWFSGLTGYVGNLWNALLGR